MAAGLPFAPSIQALADQVTAGMAQKGSADFNSLHLRVEADAKDWMDIIGGSRVPGPSGLLFVVFAIKHRRSFVSYMLRGALLAGVVRALFCKLACDGPRSHRATLSLVDLPASA